jgi:ribonuclease Z
VKITFLGTDSVTPGPDHDTATFLIDGRILIDTGWSVALRLRRFGFDAPDLTALFLTHCHHDHYLGLPGLLFDRGMRAPGAAPLPVYGPAEDVTRIVELSCAFLQADRYPNLAAAVLADVRPLAPGDAFEDDRLRVEAFPTHHTVPSVGYRITDRTTSRVAALTGDTAYFPALVDSVRAADLLVTEASFGAAPAPPNDQWLHLGAPDAARLAREAGVGRLALVHCRGDKQKAALASARQDFPNTFWPADGETVQLV